MGDFVFWDDFKMPMAVTHQAVSDVLKSKSMGREIPVEKRTEIRPELQAFYDIEAHSMLELEPPIHTRLRGLVLRAFTRRSIQALAPEISQISDQLISAFPDEPFDLMQHFAKKLPVVVIARLLGVPQSMGDQLVDWSNRMVAMYQARRTPEIEVDAAEAAREFADFIRTHIDQKRANPTDDLISQLIAAEEDGQRLSTDEMVTTCILLLNAGHEATVHTIGNSVRQLLKHGARHDVLEPELIENTVEECLRFDPPLHMFTRHVYEPVTICDIAFKPGDEIGCLLGSSCRDDAVWPDGDVFDPVRAPRKNTAFGAGIHFCVGAPLARLELQIALPVLFSRCPKLRTTEPPRVANLYHFRGLERLMVTTR